MIIDDISFAQRLKREASMSQPRNQGAGKSSPGSKEGRPPCPFGNNIISVVRFRVFFFAGHVGVSLADETKQQPAQTLNATDYDDMHESARAGTLIGRPNLEPEWTWMTEGQAARVLKARGYEFIFNLERDWSFRRGKMMRDGACDHAAINRYAEVFGHMDRKSLVASAGHP